MNHLSDILFLDIETAPLAQNLDELPAELQELWLKKFETLRKTEEEETKSPSENYFARASIFSEFARIVCISIGIFHNGKLRVKSIASKDEKTLLAEFSTVVCNLEKRSNIRFCGHNIKEFDIPFICRRLLINGLKVPMAINVAGKKPWEVPFIDTLDLWRFGDYKSYTSLKLLTEVLHIPTPKDDIDGSQVASVYYIEDDLARISRYCQKDVIATVRLYQRLCSLPLLKDEEVDFL